MNVDGLLAHYERVADTSDAIPRLRKFILNLAMRGKLVPQDPRDELASEMLRHAASLRRSGNVESRGNGPFELPARWFWTPLALVAQLEMGQSPPSEYYNQRGQGLPFFQGKADFGHRSPAPRYWCTRPSKCAGVGDILMSVRAPVGPTNVADQKCCIGRGLAALRPNQGVDRDFLLVSLKAFEADLMSLGFGTTFVAINKKQLASFPIPLPPEAEQRRIVTKVDELMALCDSLEAARKEREATRDRLTATSLARLACDDPDFAGRTARSRFALSNFASLSVRPDQIKRLRQTILGLAIRGRLVPQDPNSEAASELLRYIADTRRRFYAEGMIPKPKKLSAPSKADLSFCLPVGWSWSMLGDLCYQVADGPHFSPQYVGRNEGVPFLSTRNVRPDGFDLSSVKYVSRSDHNEFCKRIRPEKDDIIYTKGGTTGIAKVNDLDFEFSIWVHLAVLRIEKEKLSPRYVELALNSPHCYAQSQRYTRGISNFDRGLTRMIKITVPLPPLAEQLRIVAKVDELMQICDRLELSLVSGEEHRSRLLRTLITEALRPIEMTVA